jgi:hypothetical protein
MLRLASLGAAFIFALVATTAGMGQAGGWDLISIGVGTVP